MHEKGAKTVARLKLCWYKFYRVYSAVSLPGTMMPFAIHTGIRKVASVDLGVIVSNYS
jgi:hypothetical protein